MRRTPGKWEAKSNTDGSWVVMSGDIVIALFDRKDFPEWNEANARLIAAAPELFEALQPFANFACDDWQSHGCYNCIAKRAIAKAEKLTQAISKSENQK